MPKKIQLNEEAFDQLTPESAYWLGFLYADGNIYHNKLKSGKTSIRLTFCLAAKDAVAVKAFKGFLEADGGLYFRPKTKALAFSITNNYLGKRLIELGVVPRKSAKIRYPKIISELKLDAPFIRGYIDGDGSVGYCEYRTGNQKGRKAPFIMIASNRDFITGVGEVLERELDIPPQKFYSHKEDKGRTIRGRKIKTRDPYFGSVQWRFSWEKTKEICDWLTADGGFYIHRKIGRFYEAYHEYYLGNGKHLDLTIRILQGYEYEVSEGEQEKIVEEYLDGEYWEGPVKHLRQLAKKYNIKYTVLVATLKKHKVYKKPNKGQQPTKVYGKQKKEIIQRYLNGEAVMKLSEEYDVSRAAINNYIKNEGHELTGYNRFLTHNGKTQSVMEWANELGVREHTLYNRLKRGWSVERTLTEDIDMRCSPYLSPEIIEMVREIRLDKRPAEEVAKEYNIRAWTVRDIRVGRSYKKVHPELIWDANIHGCKMVTIDGKTQHVAAWARERGIPEGTVHSRLNKLGWTPEQALEFEPHPKHRGEKTKWAKLLEYNGEIKRIDEWAEELDVATETIYSRLRKGLTVEGALTMKKGDRIIDKEIDLELEESRRNVREQLRRLGFNVKED